MIPRQWSKFIVVENITVPYKVSAHRNPTIMLSPMNDVWNKCVPEHYKESCYRPQTKFVKVMFLQVPVCPQGGLCLEGSLSRWVVPVQGVSVQGDLCPGGGGLCPGGFCPGGLCPEGSLSRGSLFPRGVSVQDGEFLSRGGLCPGEWSLSGWYVRAVRILLECILVHTKILSLAKNPSQLLYCYLSSGPGNFD